MCRAVPSATLQRDPAHTLFKLCTIDVEKKLVSEEAC